MMRFPVHVVAAASLLLVTQLASAQPPAVPAAPAEVAPAVPIDERNANEVRQRLGELLREYPPSVAQVLRLDPSLATRAEYLQPYPRLAAFLQQHPQIVRNPSFFFGQGSFGSLERADPRTAAFTLFEHTMERFFVFIGLMSVLAVIAFLVRQLVEYRRWLRQTRVQTEVHTKILDRLGSNEDLLAYIQTPAGRNFLASSPFASGAESKTMVAPIGRILWAVQAGIVCASLGAGLWLVQRAVMEEIAPAFSALGTVVLALGAGLVLSAIVSYVISVRLGLMSTAGISEQSS